MAEANKTYPENDPRHHTAKIKGLIEELASHLREDIAQITEPKAQTLFETSAEVLGGLKKAFDHYEQGAEQAFCSR